MFPKPLNVASKPSDRSIIASEVSLLSPWFPAFAWLLHLPLELLYCLVQLPVCVTSQISASSNHMRIRRDRPPFCSVHQSSYIAFHICLAHWSFLVPSLYHASPFATDRRGWGSRLGTRDEGEVYFFGPNNQGVISRK